MYAPQAVDVGKKDGENYSITYAEEQTAAIFFQKKCNLIICHEDAQWNRKSNGNKVGTEVLKYWLNRICLLT